MISAYLSVFDDWQLLGPSMASIEPLVDEIVVVDGAYRWVAPHLEPERDPARSDERVREALAPFAHKTRFIEGVWRDEMEKRIAGFEACRGRWVLKADADEIVFPSGDWDRLLQSPDAVGQTEMLHYLAPGWVAGPADQPPPRQGVLFDRARISPLEHLSYTWLVYAGSPGVPEIPPADGALIQPEPIARHAHLTQWRPCETALNRARFYVLNMHRRSGRALPALPLRDHLLRSSLVNEIDADGDFAVRPTPLSAAEEARFARLYEPYMDGVRALAADLAEWRRVGPMRRGVTRVDRPPVVFDISGDTAGLTLEFREIPTYVEAQAQWIFTDAPWVEREGLETTVDGATVTVALPRRRPWLRRSLRLWFDSAEPQFLRVRGL